MTPLPTYLAVLKPGTVRNSLTVVSEPQSVRRSNGRPVWRIRCRCLCGSERDYDASSVHACHVQTCGCRTKPESAPLAPAAALPWWVTAKPATTAERLVRRVSTDVLARRADPLACRELERRAHLNPSQKAA